MIFDDIFKEASRYEECLREHRRALHQIPEVGYEEHKTHAYLMQHLRALKPDDLKVYAKTGIRAVFHGDGTGRVIAFRSDIDALPIPEATGCAFASQHPGRMHACGHDGHMANLLTFARWLSEHRENLCDDVVLLFQPAEETIGGAKNMIEEGALEEPHVEVVYGMHMMPDVPIGKVSTCAGPMMAQTCEMDFVIHGQAAHGAMPHLGCDAVTAMAHFLTLLQTTVARSVDPAQPALITIGHVEAGHQRNILAEEAKLEGIIRTFSNTVYAGLETRILQDMAGMDAAFGTKTEMIKRVFYPCVENDPTEVEHVRAVLGDRFVQEKPRMIAEDFAYYQLSVPGVFVFCGCMDENHKSPLHADTFDFDERALVTGLALFIGLTARKEEENGLF